MSFSTCSLGNELVHHFANPSFIGGNPNDGVILLNEANAQNSFKAPIAIKPIPVKPTPLENLANRIQSGLLSSIGNAEALLLKNTLLDKYGYIIPDQSVTIAGGYTITTTASETPGFIDINFSDGGITPSLTLTMPAAPTPQ